MSAPEINLFHLAVVAPLLAYLSYSGLYNTPVPQWIFWLLAALAVGVVWFHSTAYLKKTGMMDLS